MVLGSSGGWPGCDTEERVEILLLVAGGAAAEPLSALRLLPHVVRTAPRDASALVWAAHADVVVVDARTGLAEARAACRMVHAAGSELPLLAVVTEAGLVTVSVD